MSGETVTILRAGTISSGRRNDIAIDWATATETDVSGCLIAPRTSSENLDGRDAVIIGLSVFMPTGVDVLATDRLRIRGDVHTIEGQPGEWSDPDDPSCDGVEVATKRVTG